MSEQNGLRYHATMHGDTITIGDADDHVLAQCSNLVAATRVIAALEFAEHREEIVRLLDSDDPLGLSYQLRVAAMAIEKPQGFNLKGIADFLRQKSVEISALLSKLGGTANAE